MFLAFLTVLLTALSLIESSLEGEGGRRLATRISAVLPPGSWRLISAYVLRQEMNTWYLALLGWIGTLLVGSQMIKLIFKGIELRYRDHATHSFSAARFIVCFCFHLRVWHGSLPLRCVSSVGHSSSRLLPIWQLFAGSQLFDRHTSSLGDDSGDICVGLDLSCCATSTNNLEVRSAQRARHNNSVVRRQFAIWNLSSEDPIRPCLRWLRRSDRLDGMDGDLCNASLCWCGFELGKRYQTITSLNPFLDEPEQADGFNGRAGIR